MNKPKLDTKLERAVWRLIKSNSSGDIENYIKDLVTYGCESGMVNEVIYTEDAVNFYKRHRDEIDGLVMDILDGDTSQLRGWDETDPLARHSNNQNILAWFGIEEVTRDLALRIGMDI